MKDFQFEEVMEILNKIESHTGFIAKNTRPNEVTIKEVYENVSER